MVQIVEQQLLKAAMVMAFLSWLAGNVWGQVRFTVTDLGTLPGYSSQSYATGINNSGQVVGYSQASSGAIHAFLYSNGSMTDLLGTLGGNYSLAAGINDNGQVVGYITGDKPFVKNINGGMSYGWGAGGATAINNSGQIVGGGYPSGEAHAYLYSPSIGSLTDLGALGGPSESVANAINNSGQVVGQSTYISPYYYYHAFLWTSASGMQDLNSLTGSSQWNLENAYGINDNGQIVGLGINPQGKSDAFLYTIGGSVVDLGTLNGYQSSVALGINNSGQVVGFSTNSSDYEDAFLWTSTSGMQDLNSLIGSSQWNLEFATGISNSGQICGYGINPSGQTDAYLLTPSPTPEPSTLVLLAAGALGLLGYAWRRRRLAKRAAPSNQNAAPAILLLFPSNSVQTREIRRAA